MALTDRVDAYCERVGPEFWSEPLNAVTNAAFLVAALAAFLIWRRKAPDDPAPFSLIVILAAIGVGSFLFHTFATRWAGMADVVPIAVFILVYLYFALRSFLGFPLWAAILGVAGFFLLSPVVSRLTLPLVGSSAMYVPALLAIFVVGGLFCRKDRRLGFQVLATGALFVLSVAFRMLDEPLCGQIAFGTHFLWHILNSIVLFALIRVLILRRAG
ncbi:ceramidase domain-containing protein [Roseibium aggregatum]|uniref:Ceramidase domain-containing protein n=1 Tax=Roseibium aggregatum TaxID=187304 RepID=A0A939E9N5_9HYPH|nr:ceramidase domain-containing protein [Roseibium aggregatum]MBN9669167.1 ceramidase domain-containing protein [Roseibium aggregatum]